MVLKDLYGWSMEAISNQQMLQYLTSFLDQLRLVREDERAFQNNCEQTALFIHF